MACLCQVLNGASLEVQQGTFHILLGPNGCGKSTLLQVLGGLLSSDSGSFQISGPVGFVFQNPDNQVVMPTVAADVAFGLGRSASFLSLLYNNGWKHKNSASTCVQFDGKPGHKVRKYLV